MRPSLIILLALTGCDDEVAVVVTDDMAMAGGDDLAGADLSGTIEADLYGVIEDLTPAGDANSVNPSDLAGVDAQNPGSDLGGVGTSCMTACDCMPGLACFNNECLSGIVAVYCCEGATCPAQQLCQHTDGNYGQCGGGPGGTDMAIDVCPLINCKGMMGPQRCMNAGCSMCVASGNNMVCAR